MNLSTPPRTKYGAACGSVSLVLGIVVIALRKWVLLDVDLAQVACVSDSVQGDVVCMPGWILVTTAIEVAGICEMWLAVLLASIYIFISKNSKVAGKLLGPIAIVSGMLMSVGAIVKAVKFSLSVGFILDIVLAIASFIAGTLFFLGWRTESSGQPHTMF